MNEYDQRSSYQHYRGPLARPSTRHYSSQYHPTYSYSSYAPSSRSSTKTSHYVTSEAHDVLPVDGHGMFDTHYPYSSHSSHFDENEDINREMRERDRLNMMNPPPPSRHHRPGRTPGYVQSLDDSPSHPLPHSSLSSNGAYGAANYEDQYGNPLYDNSGAAYDDFYADGSSDGSSEASFRHGGYAFPSRHRQYPGQVRQTEYGREVFNGFNWVPEAEYQDGTFAHQTITRPGYTQSPS